MVDNRSCCQGLRNAIRASESFGVQEEMMSKAQTGPAVAKRQVRHRSEQQALWPRVKQFVRSWKALIDQGSVYCLIATYALLFAICFMGFASGIYIAHSTFIWQIDGFEQQYPFFASEGEWLRSLLSNVFVTHTFEIPQWTWNEGYGGDYFFIVMYCLGNPINLLSVFAIGENTETLLLATIPITLFLAGLAFIGYSHYKRFSGSGTLVGSLVYAFSGYSFIVFAQIFMAYPLVVGILILWGTDRTINGESPWLLIVGIMLSCWYSVAMAYTVCLLLVVYCIVRFAFFDVKGIRTFKRLFFCIAIPVVLGIVVSCVLFLPMAMTVLSESRLSLARPNNLFYDFSYYIDILESFFVPISLGADCEEGFPALAVACMVFGLTTAKRSDKTVKVTLIMIGIMLVFLLSPMIGRVLNGFAYPNNRWLWAYTLGVSVLVAQTLPNLLNDSLANTKRMLLYSALVASVLLLFLSFFTYVEAAVYFGFAFFLISLILCCELHDRPTLMYAALVFLLVGNICYLGYYRGTDSAPMQIPRHEAYKQALQVSAEPVLSQIEDAKEWRSDIWRDHADQRASRNSDLVSGYQETSFYNSYYNGAVSEFHSKLGLASSPLGFSFDNNGDRTAINLLSGAKYMVMPDICIPAWHPALYDTVAAQALCGATPYTAFESDDALPKAFVYSDAVGESQVQDLSSVELQSQMLHGVIVDDSSDRGLQNGTSDSSGVSSPQQTLSLLQPSGQMGVASRNAGEAYCVQTNEKDRQIGVIETDIPEDSEAYLIISDVNHTYTRINSETGHARKLNGSEEPKDVREFLNRLSRDSTDPDSFSLTATVNGTSPTSFTQYLPKSHLYSGKNTWAIRLPNTSGHVRIEITVSNPGTYTFTDAEVQTQSYSSIASAAENLKQGSAQNIIAQGNSLSCDANIDRNGEYLYAQIPYSEGWHATVDGKPADIIQANYGFSAIRMDAGDHHVEFTYGTPGLRAGFVISIIGLAASIAYTYFVTLRRRRVRNVAQRPVSQSHMNLHVKPPVRTNARPYVRRRSIH